MITSLPVRIKEKIKDRFWKSVSIGEDCWNWNGTVTPFGYGSFSFLNRSRPAHRISYIFKYGKIPNGLVLDHLCRNPGCVNPDHLEPVTHFENAYRGIPGLRRAVQICERGHRYTSENTKWKVENVKWKRGRECRICRHIRDHATRASRCKGCRHAGIRHKEKGCQTINCSCIKFVTSRLAERWLKQLGLTP